MSSSDGAILVAVIAFIGVIIAPIINGLFVRSQEHKRARQEYLNNIVMNLINWRGDLQYHQIHGWYAHASDQQKEELEAVYGELKPEDIRKMEIAFGKCYAIMASVDIPEIRKLAPIVMDENKRPDEKLKAIDAALARLGEEYGLLNINDFSK